MPGLCQWNEFTGVWSCSASGRKEGSKWTLAKLDLNNDKKNSEFIKVKTFHLNDFKSPLGFTCLKGPEDIIQASQKTTKQAGKSQELKN